MKIGIITLLGNNYGNRLQNYAVQEILKEYGDVYTVPYEKKNPIKEKKNFRKCSPLYIKKVVENRLLNMYYLSDRKKNLLERTFFFLRNKKRLEAALLLRKKSFENFDRQYIQYEENKLRLHNNSAEDWIKEYNVWVCGSDQIWNPFYPTTTANAFLQFAEKGRRVAFAASIGVAEIEAISDEQARWISEIPYLSVREGQAADIIKKLTGKEAQIFLDPTMILPKKKWDLIADTVENVKLPSRFALSYFLGIREKEYQNYINQWTHDKDVQLVDLLNGDYPEYLSLGPAEMISAIKRAEMVFVDSFHGAVFSILFHKQFVVFERKEKGMSMNSRLQTLLEKFNMENRVFSVEHANCLDEIIDYSRVDKIIVDEQMKVKTFLDRVMCEIKEMEKEQRAIKKAVEISRKEHCFGCGACSQVCPQNCIQMKEDAEGFLYPDIDMDKCIHCGKCRNVCPYYKSSKNEIKDIYAAINSDSEIRGNSSSGGTFYQICKTVISDGGIVFGCAWDENMTARHIGIQREEDIYKLQGSKYVQSALNETFNVVKNELATGRRVVFSGTPCQVAGIKNFLGKDYPNLLLVDVLCHGVPSPKLLRKYQDSLEKTYNSKIVYMNVRDKRRSWHRLHTKVRFENGQVYYKFSGYDTYMAMFLTNMSQRPSCFECRFTENQRQGDITLGDFWGVGKYNKDMDDDKGTSLVVLNSQKGIKIWGEIQDEFKIKKMNFEIALEGNRVLCEPPKMNAERDSFYEAFIRDGYDIATRKYVNIPGKAKQLYYDLMRKGLDIYRWMFRKKY